MSMSAFFKSLQDGYQSEIEDLRHDSDGADVLKQRLREKRSQLGFLVQMMALSPEMVASVFHGTFHFDSPQAMEKILRLEDDELPDWPALAKSVQLNSTGEELARIVLKEPRGAWFLTVAAALEYLYHRVDAAQAASGGQAAQADSAEGEGPARTRRARDLDDGHDWDPDDAQDASEDVDQDEASQDWLERQGFDRKE